MMVRWIGLALIAVGYLVLTVSLPGLRASVVTVMPGHGIELSDAIGGAAIVVGVAAVWYRRR